ncbi:secreted phosphoprotein 24-like isoform X5 [Salvelinus fontinalis]|uniref:secreted phosphoprotein 24-like isoform X5 n=1 Tax=Salvelinus fontinalis TaxID=8038 RepID=UPI002485F806|nr:secreted phosphoprotein 24-like isoform X5 [Salvelinus fontinalis]
MGGIRNTFLFSVAKRFPTVSPNEHDPVQGLPLYQSELASMADEALVVSMSQVNNLYAGLRLYRVTHGSVKRNLAIRPRGLTTADHVYGVEWFADVNVVNRVPHSGGCYFGIKETDCLKSSGEDPQRCALSGLLCAGHLLHHTSALCFRAHSGCGQNSSESSSEENFTRQKLNM